MIVECWAGARGDEQGRGSGQVDGQSFELTSKWQRRVYPWRGYRGSFMRLKVDAMPAAEYAAVVASRMNQRLLDPDSDPALVDIVTSASWDAPDPVALGALACTSVQYRRPGADRLIAWVAETHGLPVAVATLLQSKLIQWSNGSWGSHYPLRYGTFWWSTPGSQPEVVDLRIRIAGATDDDYTTVTDLLRTVDSSANATALAAFLAPTEDDLVERAFAETSLLARNSELLISAAANSTQLSAVLASDIGSHLAGYLFYPNMYATAMARLGGPAVQLVVAALEQHRGTPERAELLDLLSMSPSPDAFRTLIAHQEMRGAHAALRSSIARFPAPALTALLTIGGELALYEAEAFARSQPDTVEALLPTLDRQLADRLRELTVDDEALPEADPLPTIPTGAGKPGPWLVAQMLPPLLLRDGQHRLRRDRVDDVLRVLAAGDGPARELANVLYVHCEPASLAAWARSLFVQYEHADYPAKDRWALTLQGWVGDDDTVDHLVPKIRAWPGESGNARALVGLDALGDIGTELALRELYQISQKVPFKALRTRAEEKIAFIATQLNLTPEQLADRLVPDYGFDGTATLILDYGQRSFTISLDDGLRPILTGADGKVLKTLPKPSAADDAELAAAASKQLSAVKKQLRGFTTDQANRLRRAMRHQRRLPADDFHAYYVAHPLMNIVSRQLVWGAFDDIGHLRTSFTVGPDHTFTDHLQQPVTLSGGEVIGLVHPVQLDDYTLRAWQSQAAEWNPWFAQLSCCTNTLTDAERNGSRIERATGWRLPTGAVLGMTKWGWARGVPQDAGVQNWMELRTSTGEIVTLDLEPGIPVGAVTEFPEQVIKGVSISTGTFGDIDPILATEILNDLEQLSRQRLS
ncbi:DUF4132 domain-containing protein [Mycolicibacterium sp. Y3]